MTVTHGAAARARSRVGHRGSLERPRLGARVSLRHAALLLALAIVLAVFGGCAHRARAPARDAASPASADHLYRAGLALAARGDLTRAEQYLATAHREGERSRATLVALLAVCVRAGRLRSAIVHAQPYLHAHPQETPLLTLLASVHFALGELAPAESLATRALRIEPARAEAHYLLARVHYARSGRASVSHRERRERARAMRHHFASYLSLTPHGAHAEEARAALQGDGVATPARGR